MRGTPRASRKKYARSPEKLRAYWSCDRFFCKLLAAIGSGSHMKRLKGFQELASLDEALEDFSKRLRLKKLSTVIIPLEESLGRVIGNPIIAEADLPPFDRSAVDGYALRAEDTARASQFQPTTLRLVKKQTVGDGEMREIWTGNALPKGADAVAMLEHAKRRDGDVEISVSLTPGANVSKKGEDVKKGEVMLDEGVRIRPHHLGLLAAFEKTEVEVVRKPKIAIVSTGNELVGLGERPRRISEIVETNSIILSGMCAELGAEAFSLGIAKDDKNDIKERIIQGLEEADILITTGGTSVGVHDLVPEVVEQIEPNGVVVHGIAIRPGMPTGLAVLRNKPVAILSGNPVAAAIGFEIFVRPLIQKLLGIVNETRIKLEARLTRRIAGALGRRVFLRVRVVEREGEIVAQPVRAKGSGIITTMTKANGYVVIPEDREGLTENETVTVHLFDTVRKEG